MVARYPQGLASGSKRSILLYEKKLVIVGRWRNEYFRQNRQGFGLGFFIICFDLSVKKELFNSVILFCPVRMTQTTSFEGIKMSNKRRYLSHH